MTLDEPDYLMSDVMMDVYRKNFRKVLDQVKANRYNFIEEVYNSLYSNMPTNKYKCMLSLDEMQFIWIDFKVKSVLLSDISQIKCRNTFFSTFATNFSHIDHLLVYSGLNRRFNAYDLYHLIYNREYYRN